MDSFPPIVYSKNLSRFFHSTARLPTMHSILSSSVALLLYAFPIAGQPPLITGITSHASSLTPDSQYQRRGGFCGAYSQYTCPPDATCVTSNNIASCQQIILGRYCGFYLQISCSSNQFCTTSNTIAYCASVTVLPTATTSSSFLSASCQTDSGETPCGPICCGGSQAYYLPGQCTAIPPATVTASSGTCGIGLSSCAETIGEGCCPNGWQCGSQSCFYISPTKTGGLGTSTMASYYPPIRPTSVTGTTTTLNSTVGITRAPLPISSNSGGNMIKVRIFWMLVIALLFHSAVVIRC
jgi:hypothetical protein